MIHYCLSISAMISAELMGVIHLQLSWSLGTVYISLSKGRGVRKVVRSHMDAR